MSSIAMPINNGPFPFGRPDFSAVPPSGQQQDLSNEENRRRLTKMIMRLFDHWKLTTADQLELLGLSANSRRMLSEYRKNKALPNNRDILDRLGWLLIIHEDLRTLYPNNPDLCYTWINKKIRHLDNWTPLEVMKKQGLIGIFRVTQLLEHFVEL